MWTAPPNLVIGAPVAAPPPPGPVGDGLFTGLQPDRNPPSSAAPSSAPQGQPSQVPAQQPKAPVQAPQTAGQRPGTIRLPQGGTATLVRQEVGADGVLPVPERIDEATWWGAGLEAQAGATVLAGHVNWRGSTGPFAELWYARAGEDISVLNDKGTKYTYRISSVVTLHKNELPSRAGELFAQTGSHRLVLVTCGGHWVGGELGYDENQVVIAQPVA
ncbi:class F sortase [Solihabitans fulvus]|uniref:Class F sortase n=1 Tax=Solihabitans fulvus TaxID=1892852 RepID=A0A5B2XK65_9PSEU|nr:class F sortase [Solihabitans fulvus]